MGVFFRNWTNLKVKKGRGRLFKVLNFSLVENPVPSSFVLGIMLYHMGLPGSTI